MEIKKVKQPRPNGDDIILDSPQDQLNNLRVLKSILIENQYSSNYSSGQSYQPNQNIHELL